MAAAILATVSLPDSAPAEGIVRLSWGTCEPHVAEAHFEGPAVYKLVISATGIQDSVIGHYVGLMIGPKVPDAWRFDDWGCQGSSRMHAVPEALSPTCPALVGAADILITFYAYDEVTRNAIVRMAVLSDTLAADPLVRYTLWQVDFDHTRSVLGEGEPGVTCGGAFEGEALDLEFADLILSNGSEVPLATPDSEGRVFWNPGPYVRTRPSTWGALKALYR